MMTVDVRSRVEPELKSEAEAVLKAAGLDVSTAIRLFLRCVVETGKMPIDFTRPNPTTIAAIKAAKAGKVTKTTLDDL
jgi:DNA-damage-inducible protein J